MAAELTDPPECISYTAGNSNFRSQVEICVTSVSHDGDTLTVEISFDNQQITDEPFFPIIDLHLSIDALEVYTLQTDLYHDRSITIEGVGPGPHQICIEDRNSDIYDI